MAEHAMGLPFPPSSGYNSSYQNNPFSGGGGASGSSPSLWIPTPSVAYHHYQQVVPTPPAKRPPGRPIGSKNKPKPPVVIHQDNEQTLKTVVIEIPAGADVVQEVIDFAHRRHVGISVLSGTGSVSSVTLGHPVSNNSAFTFHGPFTLLSLNGTYISPPSPPPSPTPPHPLAAASSSSTHVSPSAPPFPPLPDCSSFTISLLGNQAHLFSGVVKGKVVADSQVVVAAIMFKNPEFHKVSIEEAEEGDNNPNVGGAGGNDTMSAFNL